MTEAERQEGDRRLLLFALNTTLELTPKNHEEMLLELEDSYGVKIDSWAKLVYELNRIIEKNKNAC